MGWWAVLTGTIKTLVHKGDTGKHSPIPPAAPVSAAVETKEKSTKEDVKTYAAFWQDMSFNFGMALLDFSTNTLIHILEQGLALQKAIPMLLHNKQGNDIAKGMFYVLANDIAPVLLLHMLNHQAKYYLPQKNTFDNTSTASAVFSSALVLSHYALEAYTWKKGIETMVHVAVLDAFAPAAFNSNKKQLPPSYCDTQECSTSRRIKGMGRELGVLWANDILIGTVSYLPFVGSYLGQVLKIMNHGRYITRVVTPERCEDHKFMKQEFVLAVGLLYECTSQLLDRGLSATTGPLPFIYLRALRHLLLAMHVNMAAHSLVPLVQEKNRMRFDLFHYYEQSSRFVFEVLWAGLLKRIPIDLKAQKRALLSPLFQGGIYLFNYDLEQETIATKATIRYKMKQWVLPKMLHSAHDFVQDPVLAPHWPKLCDTAIVIFTAIEHHGKSSAVTVMQWSPETAAKLLEASPLHIPKQVTRTVIMLSKESDFWDLTAAIKAWFERHQKTKEAIKLLPVNEAYGLLDNGNEAEQIWSTPSSPKALITIPAAQLMPRSPNTPFIDEGKLRVQEQRKETKNHSVSATPATLFAPKRSQNIHTLDPYALGLKKKV